MDAAHTSQPASAGNSRLQSFGLLLLAALVTVACWHVPYGGYVLYPFTILATWFHEMGHGMAGLLVGAGFQSLTLYPDGSGVAITLNPHDQSPAASAFISAGGPLGPAVAGAIFIALSRQAIATRILLGALGAVLIGSTLIWVDGTTGWLMLPAMGLALIGLAWRGGEQLRGFAAKFLGLQAAISMFRQSDYLFTRTAQIGGRNMASDTEAIAQQLWLPHWFWAGAIIAVAGVLIAASFAFAWRR